MLRVLVVKMSSLGDVVHALPVVHDVVAAHPGTQIDWVVEPGFLPLVRRVDGIGKPIPCALRRWRRGWWTAPVRAEWRAFKADLQRDRYDAVLDLQGLTKSALIARMARCTKGGMRFGPANRTQGAGWEVTARWLADRAIHIEPRTHAIASARILAGQALGHAVTGEPVFGLRSKGPPAATPVVVLVHGTSRADKLWPEANWIALAGRLVAQGARIALPQGNDDEGARSRRLAAAIGGEHCEVWPSMSLDALVDRMAAARGVIGVDSGPSHIAVALDLPHVQIYNFPTAWRTGPPASPSGRRQVSVGGGPAPSVDEVWAAWQHAFATLADMGAGAA